MRFCFFLARYRLKSWALGTVEANNSQRKVRPARLSSFTCPLLCGFPFQSTTPLQWKSQAWQEYTGTMHCIGVTAGIASGHSIARGTHSASKEEIRSGDKHGKSSAGTGAGSSSTRVMRGRRRPVYVDRVLCWSRIHNSTLAGNRKMQVRSRSQRFPDILKVFVVHCTELHILRLSVMFLVRFQIAGRETALSSENSYSRTNILGESSCRRRKGRVSGSPRASVQSTVESTVEPCQNLKI